jgi:signal transduction histidine kinase
VRCLTDAGRLVTDRNAVGVNDDREVPGEQKIVAWLGLGTVAYVALGLLGRATIPDGEVLSLVWPAAGIAMLMFGLTPRRWWWLAALLVAAAALPVNFFTGASASQAAVFAVSNVFQAVVAVLLLRALAPYLLGAGGRDPLERLQDFWAVLASCVVAALAGAVVGSFGRGLLGDWTLGDGVVWWARNATGSLALFTTGIFALATWQQVRRPGGKAELGAILRERATEMLLIVTVTLLLYLAFFVDPWLPVAFPLLVPTVWVGLRFAPLPVALHSLAVSAAVVVFTLTEHGPFASLDSWAQQVLVSQLFIGLVFCLGTLLAVSRGERLTLTRTLATAQLAAQNQAELMSTIIDSMHDGVSVIDERGQVVLRNPAGAAMVQGHPTAPSSTGDYRFVMQTLDGRELSGQDFPWARAMVGEDVADEDTVVVFDDGTPSRTFSVSARRLPSSNEDGLQQAVVIYHDVTTDRAQRSELESFAGVVAHDLLGPLTMVEGWAEMLASDLNANGSLAGPDASLKVGRISAGAQGMRRLIQDLLESSTSRDQTLHSTVVDLDSMARWVAEHRPEMTSSAPPYVEVASLPEVYADGAMVRRLLDNLIGNAIKYVAPGEVARVTVTARDVDDMVEVTVADEGIGIPADQRDRVFEAFHRATGAAEYDGHGIGLSVCKRIVERHGGRISAEPPLGERGARIVFTLPAASAATPPTM